jgi:hypothetical protein
VSAQRIKTKLTLGALTALAVVVSPAYWHYEGVRAASSHSREEGTVASAQEHSLEPRSNEVD